LFEEGDGGVVGGLMLLKKGQRRLSLVIRDGRVSARFEEKMDEGGDWFSAREVAGKMKCCPAIRNLHVDRGSDARVLEQALH
jgi:hypothetical protein